MVRERTRASRENEKQHCVPPHFHPFKELSKTTQRTVLDLGAHGPLNRVPPQRGLNLLGNPLWLDLILMHQEQLGGNHAAVITLPASQTAGASLDPTFAMVV